MGGLPNKSAAPARRKRAASNSAIRTKRVSGGGSVARPFQNPTVWVNDFVVTVHEVKSGFNDFTAEDAIKANLQVAKEYRWTSITATWNPLLNENLGTVAIMPYYVSATKPDGLSNMIVAGVRTRNGLNTFTQTVAAVGEQMQSLDLTPVPATGPKTQINGGVTSYVAARSATTSTTAGNTVGWLRVHWKFQSRYPVNSVKLANP